MTLADKIRAAHINLKKPALVLRPELLLCQNIPKPLHGVAPRNVLGAKWWEATRQAAYASTSYHCLACGVWKYDARFRSWLEAHEVYTVDYQKGRMVYVETVPLCFSCHAFVHDGRLRMLLDQGQINHAKYAAVLQHGEQVLKAAGLKRLAYNERDNSIWLNGVADWSDWRLIINIVVDGKRIRRSVRPKFKNQEDWEKHHAQ